jgi:TolA-binding protein
MKPTRSSAIAEARARAPSWNDLRERRLMHATWSRFQQGDNVPGENRWLSPRRVAVAGAALALVAAVVVVARWQTPEPTATPTAVVASERTVAFNDGSQATLVGEAGIRTVMDRAERVEVVQRVGKVSYKVRPDRKREFVVRAGDVSVVVLGTRFSVELGESLAEVRVLEGKVRVVDKRRTTELVAGETLNLQAFHAQGASEEAAEEEANSEKTTVEPQAREAARSAEKPAALSAQELLAQADEARAAQNWNEAVQLLRTLLARYPATGNKSNVLFMLARAERNRGSHAEAALVFGKCAAQGGTLASEALAEEAASWLKAGQRDRAVRAAERYVKRYPNGPHAEKMQRLVE